MSSSKFVRVRNQGRNEVLYTASGELIDDAYVSRVVSEVHAFMDSSELSTLRSRPLQARPHQDQDQ
jgi:hypothetical protein